MTGPDLPLAGVRVLDFSTLLPGPLATLMMAEAGADVVKIERPETGDEMRSYEPKLGGASANFAFLNRGKRAFAVDLKDKAQRDRVLELAAIADVVVEQFRPGVMDRLGLGDAKVRATNPRVVYCSITGYGPVGDRALRAGHDLNYLAESGLLGTVTDRDGSPMLPVSVIADIAAGAYPAVVNVLLALRSAERTGRGAHLQVSMTHNLQLLAYGHLATYQTAGSWPRPSGELLTGGSPRYRVYSTSDGRHVACAALEQKFWDRLIDLLGLDPSLKDDSGREAEVAEQVAAAFASRTADHWRKRLDGEDVCVTVVATWEEAVKAGHVRVDGADLVTAPGDPSVAVPTLPSPLDPAVRDAAARRSYPGLSPLPDHPVWRASVHAGTDHHGGIR